MPTTKRLERLLMQRRFREASECIAAMDPETLNKVPVLRGRAVLAHYQGRLQEAERLYRSLVDDDARIGDVAGLGSLLMQQGRYRDALAHYRTWLERWPEASALLRGRGDAHAALGEPEEARHALRRAVENDPGAGVAWYRLTTYGDYDWLHGHREALLAQPDPGRPPHDQYGLLFAAGRYLEHRGEYDAAFRRLNAANQSRRRWGNLDLEALFAEAETLIREWRAQDWSQTAAGDPEQQPILIAGMPRSGTSLVEQILASHPEVRGLGELDVLRQVITATLREGRGRLADRDWRRAAVRYLEGIEGLRGDSPRFTDKSLFGFAMIGFMLRMFPHARVVHCRRDALDTCVACFRTNFSNLDLSYTLRELGLLYGYYDGMMEFWQAQFPQAIMTVRYEDLVAETGAQVERLLAHAELPWSDRCMAFHENRRVVLTASMEQVRQPVYSSAVGRAAPYRKHLGALEDGMHEGRARLRHAMASGRKQSE